MPWMPVKSESSMYRNVTHANWLLDLREPRWNSSLESDRFILQTRMDSMLKGDSEVFEGCPASEYPHFSLSTLLEMAQALPRLQQKPEWSRVVVLFVVGFSLLYQNFLRNQIFPILAASTTGRCFQGEHFFQAYIFNNLSWIFYLKK